LPPSGGIIRPPIMRLITYDRGGARRLGACVGEAVVDLPEAVGHPAFPPTMEALVQHIGGSILDAANDILEDQEIVDECAVKRPTLLPAILPSSKRIGFINEKGRETTPAAGCFAAGLACIIGAGRAPRMSRHEPGIFGYTLAAHWVGDKNGASRTSLGPCIVTPDHLHTAGVELRLQIDGEPVGTKVLERPNEFLGAVVGDSSRHARLEAGDVLVWRCWAIRANRSAIPLAGDVELSADPIGVLRTSAREAAARTS
jgi:hypothetical protein